MRMAAQLHITIAKGENHWFLEEGVFSPVGEPSTIMFNIMPSVKGELITRSSSNITKQDKGGWFRG